jgi:hypothetical protein
VPPIIAAPVIATPIIAGPIIAISTVEREHTGELNMLNRQADSAAGKRPFIGVAWARLAPPMIAP